MIRYRILSALDVQVGQVLRMSGGLPLNFLPCRAGDETSRPIFWPGTWIEVVSVLRSDSRLVIKGTELDTGYLQAWTLSYDKHVLALVDPSQVAGLAPGDDARRQATLISSSNEPASTQAA
jgi:hypothetical protein